MTLLSQLHANTRQNGRMSDEHDCYLAAIGTGEDPSGVPWAELDPALLRTQRHSIKWTRYPADVLPLFVAEMDFAVAPEIRRALVRAVEASDTGYLSGPGPLAGVFADYAKDRWDWEVLAPHVHLATDVATGIVESLRVFRPAGGRLALPTPCYPGFFEMLLELNFEVVEIALGGTSGVPGAPGDTDTGTGTGTDTDTGTGTGPAYLDLAAIEREFASDEGIDAFILCNPHNPHGVPFSTDELTALARLAAEHDVFVVSDEIHAPLTHSGATFTPFAPLAANAGALSVTTTSASKGFNLAGAKCSVIVAADERANRLLETLPPEVATRTSILGLHANVAAFEEAHEWHDRALAQIEANQLLLQSLLRAKLPEIKYSPGTAGYLAWLDLRDLSLGDARDAGNAGEASLEPAAQILQRAKVALNNGRDFGAGGSGHARMNLACAPDTIVRAIDRIAHLATQAGGAS